MKRIFDNRRINLCFSIIIVFFLFHSSDTYSQARINTLRDSLENLSDSVPGLKQEIDLTVSDLSIQEFLRIIANSNNLNIDVDQSLLIFVSNNFTKVTPTDILLYLCRRYDLEITFSGKIMSVSKFTPPEEPPPVYQPKEIVLHYDSITDRLSFDLRRDSLFLVAKQITINSGKNVLIKPEIKDELVSGYIHELIFEDALEKFAFANDLVVTKEDFAYLLEKKKESEIQALPKNRKTNKKNSRQTVDLDFDLEINSINDITIYAVDIPLMKIINEVSYEVGVNYFILNNLSENITLNLKNISYNNFLENILYGTKYTFELEDNIYLIGERLIENLRESKTIKLRNRSVADIISFIPAQLQNDVEIFEMVELNCLIVSGSEPMIRELELFIQDIDMMVPVILIEVMIITYKKGYTISTGLTAGLSDKPVETSGSIIPVDITIGSSSINNLLASFNGAGAVNLGRVTPNFYISLKALETNGIVKVRSTPKLSTLNGHEAKMTIGNTEYYLEEKSQIFANQTTTQEKTRQFKPVNADFNLIIFPVVSGDEQITLDITVEQSDFTGTKLAPDAPPDQVKRSFSSMIRIKNEEMILLGGLEEYTKERSGSGVPFLSRIPVIKWFFSSRKKVDNEDKLNIFIKPTVIY